MLPDGPVLCVTQNTRNFYFGREPQAFLVGKGANYLPLWFLKCGAIRGIASGGLVKEKAPPGNFSTKSGILLYSYIQFRSLL